MNIITITSIVKLIPNVCMRILTEAALFMRRYRGIDNRNYFSSCSFLVTHGYIQHLKSGKLKWNYRVGLLTWLRLCSSSPEFCGRSDWATWTKSVIIFLYWCGVRCEFCVFSFTIKTWSSESSDLILE